ncbi:MAG: penicillin-binding protein 2 [Patescibacteria group bacterium]|nr:penicillin-binding protein 2 [Patescibacteria group bacterium]
MFSRSAFASRIRFVAGIMLLAWVLIIGRLYYVQVMHGAEYRSAAEGQYVKQSSTQLDRGSIFFTAKDGTHISAATLATGDTIAFNPQALGSATSTYAALAPLLPALDEQTFTTAAAKKNLVYVAVAKHVSSAVGDKIIALNLPGVLVLADTWRYYPGGDLASHEIGFLAYGPDGTTEIGQYGLERYYDTALSRVPGGLYVNFFADLFSNIRTQLFSDSVGPGADLVTTIEPTVQAYLERELKNYQTTWRAETVGGIIMDPSTGAIVAMAAEPGFDPNNFQSANPATFRNPLVSNVYEFGSVVKALTMAAGLDSGAVTPTTTYDDTGYTILNGEKINNWDHKSRGIVDMQTVLSQSLNTGAAFVEQKMGTSTFRSYFEKFGIESESGVDLPDEASPLVGNLSSPRQVEYATASFGQGIALTPVAMVRALATLANHGLVPSPHVGAELDYGGGIVKTLNWSPPRRAISAESADTVSSMLVKIMDETLANGKDKIPGYSVALKTGTAQLVDTATQGYYSDRFLHSYFGYFPAFNAHFIVFFFATDPQGAPYASETWTSYFLDTVKFLISYYNIPPDRPTTN